MQNQIQLSNLQNVPFQSQFSSYSIGLSSGNISFFFIPISEIIFTHELQAVCHDQHKNIRIVMLVQTHGSSSFLFHRASPRAVLWAGFVGPLCCQASQVRQGYAAKHFSFSNNFSVASVNILKIPMSVTLFPVKVNLFCRWNSHS